MNIHAISGALPARLIAGDTREQSVTQRRRETSGAALTYWLTADSSIIHRAMASYETGIQEFGAPDQSAADTGGSFLPRELSPARASVHQSEVAASMRNRHEFAIQAAISDV